MTTPNTGPEPTPADELAPAEGIMPEGEPDAAEGDTDVFPRKVVEDLRRESASYRDRAKTAEARAEELSRALFTARVAATGRLENPAEINYNADILDDIDAINAEIDSAIDARPYIKARPQAQGNVGQGHRGEHSAAPTFADLLRT